MKVLLLEDIKGLGKKGEVCEVKDGYGQNFLIAKNKAKQATNEVINKYKAEQKNLAEKKALETAERKGLADTLNALKITIEKKANNGALFGSITKEEIATQLAKQHRIEIDKKHIEIKNPIKQIGDFEVEIKLGDGVNATLKLQVVESKS
ncbi:50S ribosomal protein L9 [Helicobacter sp. T3_23-1059]